MFQIDILRRRLLMKQVKLQALRGLLLYNLMIPVIHRFREDICAFLL